MPTSGLRGFEDDVRCALWWDRDGPGGEAPVLVVGGEFEVAGKTLANGIALWNGRKWEPLGLGISGEVKSLTVLPDGSLVAGGVFARTGSDLFVSGVARWDGVAWTALGSGFTPSASVNGLAVLTDGTLVATGSNLSISGVQLNGLARWDGTHWTGFGSGLGGNRMGNAIAVLPSGDLVVTGSFTSVDGVSAANIAHWDGATWLPLDTGLNGTGHALAVHPDGRLSVAGAFNFAGSQTTYNVATWDGTGWQSVGTPASAPNLNNTIFALAVLGDGSLAAGGSFWTTGGAPANYVARWDGTAWRALGEGMSNFVFALAPADSNGLIALGRFLYADDVHASRVARWDGARWHPIGSGFGGISTGTVVNDLIYDFLRLPDGRIVAGGAFTAAGAISANNVALWDGDHWHPLGEGLNGAVHALARLPDGRILAGGAFDRAGDLPTKGLAAWDGLSWAPVADLLDGLSNAVVRSLLVLPDGQVLAGGTLYQATESGPSPNVLRWDGSAWQGMGEGLNGAVQALFLGSSGTLYAGGDFTRSGATTVNRVAAWDGAGWQPIGTGMNSTVAAFAELPGDILLAGGRFTTASGVSARGLARWNGETWSAFTPSGYTLTSLGVQDVLVLADGSVVIGGYFNVAGTGTNIARWDGSSWIAPENGARLGLSPGVYALESFGSDGSYVAGGGFLTMGGSVNSHFAYWAPLTRLPRPEIELEPSQVARVIRVESDVRQTYDLEFSDSLATWTTVLPHQTGNLQYQDSDAIRLASEAGFYRARVLADEAD